MVSIKKLSLVLCLAAFWSLGEASGHSAPDLLFSYHFAGTRSLATNTNAARLNEILALPESIDLRQEVFEKLARTPEQLLGGNGDRESETAKLIRPLLQSLSTVESFAEVRRGTNSPGELVLGIRVASGESKVWDSNLQKVLANLTKGKPEQTTWEKFKGWEIKRDSSPNLVRAISAGDWLVLGVGGKELPLQNNILRRLATSKNPVDWKNSTNWFEAVIDFPRLQGWLPIGKIPLKLGATEIGVTSRGGTTRSSVRTSFSEPLNWKYQKWQVPTNIVRDPLVAFTAAQNLSVLLKETGSFDQVGVNPLTNQFYVWAHAPVAMMTYAAMPVSNSAKAFDDLATRLPRNFNKKLEEKKAGKIVLSTNGQQIVWSGYNMFSPMLQATNEPAGQFLVASMFPLPPAQDPPPSELLQQFLPRTNIIYYDWEVAHQRMGHWQMLTKALPALGLKLPPIVRTPTQSTNAAGASPIRGRFLDYRWQRKVTSYLGNTSTEVALTAPNEVQLTRNSDLGFTSLELIYLTQWLNHPDFPLFRGNQVPGK